MDAETLAIAIAIMKRRSKMRSELNNIDAVANLAASGKILEVMDIGDKINPEWKYGNDFYAPEFNLCHTGTGQLENGTIINGAYFEWNLTTPDNEPFDEREALYYFDGTEEAGTYHIGIGKNYGAGWLASKSIQFTLTAAPDNGDQLVIDCDANNVDPTSSKAWKVYGAGGTTVKQSGTTSNGTGGTSLGTTSTIDEHHTNGRVNAISRSCYGYDRWSQSSLRQRLNSAESAGNWWTMQNPWDRPPAIAATLDGFLKGYGEDVYKYFKPIKHVTVACNADGNVEDITYDRVFLASLEQMYCEPQFSGKEGEAWEYYKRLLGRTTPAPTSKTYKRLIKYALNAPTAAQACFRRSASRYIAYGVWYVNYAGAVGNYIARSAYRCAPGVFLSK